MTRPTDVDLSARVGRLDLGLCVMNASGPLCTHDDELETLASSRAGAVVIKSATLEPRKGNVEPRIHLGGDGTLSINSVGLCNLGYRAHAAQAARLRQGAGKPIIASVAGFTPGEYVEMASVAGRASDAIEVNLSCPNVSGKVQVGLDPEASEAVLRGVRQATDRDIWVKLPPYQDASQVSTMAGVLRRCGVSAAVCINSPSGLDVDVENEVTVIHPNGGMGGLGGADCRRIARWNIRQFHLALEGALPVIGVGGVSTAEDVYGHILCGASAVQIGTALLASGPRIFDRIESELAGLMRRRGVVRISDKIGALRIRPEEETP